MSDEVKGKGTTLFGRVIHSAEEWKAIEDEKAKAQALLAARAREVAELAQKHDALAKRLQEVQQALAEERAAFAVKLSEAEAKRKEVLEASASARQGDAQKLKAAIESEAKRADTAEARARAFETAIEELGRENVEKLDALTKAHAAKIDALAKENAAKLDASAKAHAAKLDELAGKHAASDKTTKEKEATLENVIRDRDLLRTKLEASERERSTAAQTIELLEKAREGLRARNAVLERNATQGAAGVEADRASAAARAAIVGRIVGGVGALIELVYGAGTRTVWRWSTGKRGAGISAADLGGVLEALAVGTEVALELEASGAGVLRYATSSGDEPPAWALAITEAVLFHETGRSYTASVSRSEGKVTVRFDVAEQ